MKWPPADVPYNGCIFIVKGVCIPIMVDHEVDTQVQNLFKQIDTEQKGRLDILVNSAYKGGDVSD